MRPSLVNLETALWVARLGSFSAVARRLHTSQPAISLRIKELETALGTRLFDRRGRKMEVTPQGRAIINRIEPLLDCLNEVIDLGGEGSRLKGVVRIGSGDPPVAWLGPLLSTFQTQHPNVTVELSMGIAPRLISELESGVLDCAIISGNLESRQLISRPLGEAQAGWLMGADRWQRYGVAGTTPTLPQLLNCGPIWLVPRSSRYHQDQLDMLRAHGADLRLLNTCDNVRTIIELVASTGAIGFIPYLLVQDKLSSGMLTEVSSQLDRMTSQYSLVRPRNFRSTLVQRICEAITTQGGFQRQA
jgi:DNA-binding transcriptional LysR family regulator